VKKQVRQGGAVCSDQFNGFDRFYQTVFAIRAITLKYRKVLFLFILKTIFDNRNMYAYFNVRDVGLQ